MDYQVVYKCCLSIHPSNQPTNHLSNQPSNLFPCPTKQPSIHITVHPSIHLSIQPPNTPTNHPTKPLTIQPKSTIHLSIHPTKPSSPANKQPNIHPPIDLSNQPSINTYIQATNHPTNPTTIQPINLPCTHSSLHPSIQTSPHVFSHFCFFNFPTHSFNHSSIHPSQQPTKLFFLSIQLSEGTSRQQTLHGLMPFTTYSVRVEACTCFLCCSRGPVSELRTQASVPSQQPPPRPITLTSRSALLEWDEPLQPNGIIERCFE